MRKIAQICFAFTMAILIELSIPAWAQSDSLPDLSAKACGDVQDLETARIIECDSVLPAAPAPRQLTLPPSVPPASAEEEPADPRLEDKQLADGTVDIGQPDQRQTVQAPEPPDPVTEANPRPFAWYKGAALPAGLAVRNGQSTPDGYKMESGAAHKCYLPECIWLVPAE